MDYDIYTTDDRRFARVIPPDDGESLSGSSYIGSDASNTIEHTPVGESNAGKMPPSSQLSPHAAVSLPSDDVASTNQIEFGIGPFQTSRRPHSFLVPIHNGPPSPNSVISHEDVQEQEHISEDRGRNSTNIEAGDHIPHQVSIETEELRPQVQEGRQDTASNFPGPSAQNLNARTLVQDSSIHNSSGDEVYGVLGSGMDISNDPTVTSESTLPSGSFAPVSEVPLARGTTSSIGSYRPGRRSPPLDRTRSNSSPSNRNVRDIILPRWQPDAEVTYCPICRTQFSFFVRKHHCRRCGRVVCNACSPHRITIPYQFIVQPPPAVAASAAAGLHQGLQASSNVAGATHDFADRNGGMKVRLCNPCVPDPNPMPPQSQPQYSDISGQVPTLYLNSGSRPYPFTEDSITGGSGRARGFSAASGLRQSDQRMQQRSTSPYNRLSGTTIANNDSNSLYPNVQPGRYPSQMPRSDLLRVQGSSAASAVSSPQPPLRISLNQSRGHARSHQSLSFIPGGATSNPQPHYRSLLDIGDDQYTRNIASTNRPLPPVPRINEDDECPVCHRVLFSRTQPDFENRKAAHIIQCIEDQIAFHNGTSSRPGAYTSQSEPAPMSITAADPSAAAPPPHEPLTSLPSIPTPIANTPEARTAARERAHAAVVLGTAASSASSTPPARRTGMFIYRASEKDCVDDAECTICLEEFEVGASMARLECFCRFHKKCIQDWFVDHPGRCPVHQHDGYGF